MHFAGFSGPRLSHRAGELACATLLSGCTVGLPNGLSYLTDRSMNLQAQVAGSLPETGSYHLDYGTTTASP